MRAARLAPPFLVLALALVFIAFIAFSVMCGACGENAASNPAPLQADAAIADATAPDATTPLPRDDAGPPPVLDAARPPPFDCTEDAGDLPPTHLFCTGLYDDWDAKSLGAAVRPYEPGLVFWSDGATKARFMYLPPGTKIDTTDMDEWVFPVGFKVWKEFRLDGRRIETRLFWKRSASAWARTTYKWKDDQSDATRFDDGLNPIDGGTYEIPDRVKCDTCHQGRKDKILGIEAIGLGVAGAKGVTLASLVADGLLTAPPPATTITIPNDASGKAANALAWMHVNCGTSCHNRNPDASSSQSGLFLRLAAAQLIADAGAGAVAATDTYVTAVDVHATNALWAAQGFYRIKRGDLAKSLIVTLPETRTTIENGQMPPIATHQVDTLGVLYLKTWVLAL